MTPAQTVSRIRTILHSPRGKNHALGAYESLLRIVVNVDKRGDITNHELDDLRTILDKLGSVDEVLNECV